MRLNSAAFLCGGYFPAACQLAPPASPSGVGGLGAGGAGRSGNRERQAAKPDSAAIDAATLPATSAAHKLGTFLAAGPLAAIASLLACALLVGAVFPADERGNGMVLTAFVFPLVWAATAVWVCAVDRLLRPVGILLAIAVVASVGLMP